VNGSDDIRKTFLYNTLLTYIRSYGDIAIIVASSKIAMLLINDNRITHL